MITAFGKKFFLFFLMLQLFFTSELFSQGGLPSIVLKNGAVSVVNCWIVDPDSLRGNYSFGTTTMVVTTPPGTQVGLFRDTARMHDDFDDIFIYDGNSVSAPLLVQYFPETVPGFPPRSVKATSNVITIVFKAGQFNPIPHSGWRLGIRAISNIDPSSFSFLPVDQYAFGGVAGIMDLVDYDLDGDKDILKDGVIYENTTTDDSTYIFKRILQPIGLWRSAKMTSADFDNDGFKDVFVIGVSNEPGNTNPTSAFYKNNGNNSFMKVNVPVIPNAAGGTCVAQDFNADGLPDIAFAGCNGTSCMTKIFMNNGNFSFTEQTNNLPALSSPDFDWNDYDHDGDLDVVMNGVGSNSNVTAIYRNNSNGSFTEIGLPGTRTSYGKIKWVDINGDGKVDIFNTGVLIANQSNPIIPEILFNDGSGNFTRKATNLPARLSADFDFFDYDKDGDADIVYGGLKLNVADPLTDTRNDGAVYRNDGNGSFTQVKYLRDFSLSSTVKWIDINNDNRKDLFVSGKDNFNPGYVMCNMGADSFRIASYPFNAYNPIGGYSSNVLIDDLNGDGLTDFLFAGDIYNQDCVEKYTSSLISAVGWLKRKRVEFKKAYDFSSFQGAITDGASWKWGDVNNDGRPDVIRSMEYSKLFVFQNNGKADFSLMYSGYIHSNSNLSYAQCGVVDIDNDGINELYAAPNKLYRWNGNSFQTLYEEKMGCEFNAGFSCRGDIEFADYNGDHFMDVVSSHEGRIYVLRNNGMGRFVNDYPADLDIMYPEQPRGRNVRWMDYDGDGDLDLIARETVYENTSWGGFRNRGTNLSNFGSMAFSDFNKDGLLDVVAAQKTTAILPAEIFYNQQGSSFFQEITPSDFIVATNPSPVGLIVEDIDNDGDDDILYATGDDCTNTGIYLSQINDNRQNIHLQVPKGGETFSRGSTVSIQWTGISLGNSVKLEVSTDGGTSYSLIDASVPGGSFGGEYRWEIPALSLSTKCRVRVTDNVSGNLIDSSKNFTITVLPSITSFLPAKGAGGSVVTISGINFTGTTAVSFGEIAAQSFTVINDETINAIVSNSGASGVVKVTTGTGVATKKNFFFIAPPTITSVSPSVGTAGSQVTIKGTNLSDAVNVSFGGVQAASFIVVDSATITAVVAGGASGEVSVTTPGGIATAKGFVYIEAGTNGLTVLPNPSNNFIYIVYPSSNHPTMLKLVNMQGIVAKSIILASNTSYVEVSVKGLVAGIYQLVWDDGTRKLTRTVMVY